MNNNLFLRIVLLHKTFTYLQALNIVFDVSRLPLIILALRSIDDILETPLHHREYLGIVPYNNESPLVRFDRYDIALAQRIPDILQHYPRASHYEPILVPAHPLLLDELINIMFTPPTPDKYKQAARKGFLASLQSESFHKKVCQRIDAYIRIFTIILYASSLGLQIGWSSKPILSITRGMTLQQIKELL